MTLSTKLCWSNSLINSTEKFLRANIALCRQLQTKAEQLHIQILRQIIKLVCVTFQLKLIIEKCLKRIKKMLSGWLPDLRQCVLNVCEANINAKFAQFNSLYVLFSNSLS